MDDKKFEELLQTERSILSRLWSIDIWVTIIGIAALICIVLLVLNVFSCV